MKQGRGHLTDFIFTLTLFCLFAVSALLVVIMGADVYAKTMDSMDRNYNTRSSISYLAQKVRQNDVKDGISIRSVDGGDALVLAQSIDENLYETWIFAGDGQLREVLVAAGVPVTAQSGQPIMDLASVDFVAEGKLLTMTATDPQGLVSQMTLLARCG